MCAKVAGLVTVNGLDFGYTVVELPEYDLEELLGSPVLKTTLGVAKVLTEGKVDLFSPALLPIAELDDYEYKRFVVNLSLELYQNYLRARNQKINEVDLDRALTPIFNEQEKHNMLTTIFEDKIAEGEARGEVKGAIKTGQNAVMSVLRRRFKKIPKQIETSIRQMRDSIALESLAGDAAICKSLDDFAKCLK
jgi:hypothetical protein